MCPVGKRLQIRVLFYSNGNTDGLDYAQDHKILYPERTLGLLHAVNRINDFSEVRSFHWQCMTTYFAVSLDIFLQYWREIKKMDDFLSLTIYIVKNLNPALQRLECKGLGYQIASLNSQERKCLTWVKCISIDAVLSEWPSQIECVLGSKILILLKEMNKGGRWRENRRKK